jgi:hypothetical protein
MHDSIRPPRVLPHFLIGAVVGAVVALLSLGPFPFSFRGTVAILAAGATFGVFAAGAVYAFRDLPGVRFYPVVAIAGALGGGAWWLIVRPSSSLVLAVVIGAGITLIAALLEGRNDRPH